MEAVPRQCAFVGLGGNLGDVQAQLKAALAGLQALPGTSVAAVSSLYRTRPVDAQGPDYLNAVVALQSALGPAELLRALHRLETTQDRQRPYLNAPRTLDLDLLWYGDVHRQTPFLTLPHPRMFLRAFVLVPLHEVLGSQPAASPALASAMPAADILAALAREQGIEKLPPSADWPN
ncbi:MAG: 2-amino-4-hydroxy-6-hydroxymethyldihydropteridine diphosphokinase [Aquabacterium sp.]